MGASKLLNSGGIRQVDSGGSARVPVAAQSVKRYAAADIRKGRAGRAPTYDGPSSKGDRPDPTRKVLTAPVGRTGTSNQGRRMGNEPTPTPRKGRNT